MSNRVQRTYNDFWRLGDRVSFIHHGERLYGEIVRTSSNPTYFHVSVNGTRYEVDLHEDQMQDEMGDDWDR